MRRPIRLSLSFLLAVVVVSQAGIATAQSRFTPHIVNGVVTSQYPTTGALLFGGDAGSAFGICSGTMIGCDTFLTAAHCVCDTTGAACQQGSGAPNPSNYFVFLQHGGIFAVTSIAVRPDFNFPVGDFAVLKLSNAVTGIAPTPINTTSAVEAGTPGTIAGYGITLGTNNDYGIKRAGDVVTAACSGGISDTTSVCFNFTTPLGAPGTNSDTCDGDSGGPLFVDFGAGQRLAGVTSGGDSQDCAATDHSFDANVFNYRSWIQLKGGADLANTACGTIPPVGTPGADIASASDQLSSGTPDANLSFPVAAGTDLLRIAMSAVDDYDLYVKFGSPPTTSSFDCAQAGSSAFEYCEFSAPTPGTWYVLVHRFAGSGAYQVTATTFGAACSNPANNGQPCDDNNSCTVNDVCQNGACSGTPLGDGSACDDGNACTHPDACLSGVCTGAVMPLNGCKAPVTAKRGLLLMQEPASGQNNFQWSWRSGAATSSMEFGDPLTDTDYTLCAYGQAAGKPAVLMSAHLPAGATCTARSCWQQLANGFRYTDRTRANDGISSVRLSAGGDGRASVTILGRGIGLNLPALPLDQQTPIIVQLSNGTTCWEADYSTSLRNNAVNFRAKGD